MSLERRNHGRNHSYWADGHKLVGVTTVLRDGVPKQLVNWAAGEAADYATDHWDELADLDNSERRQRIFRAPDRARGAASVKGTLVHADAQRLLAGEEIEVPDDRRGLVDAYLRWVEEWDVHEVVVERPFFSREWAYAGTPDLVADLGDGRRWLVDYKTGKSVYNEVALQLAASRFAEVWLDAEGGEHPVPELGIEACAVLHLVSDGSYEMREAEADRKAWLLFLNAQRVATFTASGRGDWLSDALPQPVTTTTKG